MKYQRSGIVSKTREVCLTWKEEAVVDDGEEVGVGSGVDSFAL